MNKNKITEEVIKIVANAVGSQVGQITEEYEIDSYYLHKISRITERIFSFEITFEWGARINTVKDLVDCIVESSEF